MSPVSARTWRLLYVRGYAALDLAAGYVWLEDDIFQMACLGAASNEMCYTYQIDVDLIMRHISAEYLGAA